MAGNDGAGATPDDQEKASLPPKKPRVKNRPTATDDLDTDPTPAPDGTENNPHEESLKQTPETVSPADTAVASGSGTAVRETPVEPKPRSLIQLLRFERKAGKRRR